MIFTSSIIDVIQKTISFSSNLVNEEQNDRPCLWVLDENLEENALPLIKQSQNQVIISNRFDVTQHCQKLGLNSLFSDFDFRALETKGFCTIIYRVSKERPVTNHVLNQCSSYLEKAGKLILFGKKTEGIKTYFDKARKQLGFDGLLEKHKDNYIAVLTRRTEDRPQLLDTKDYYHLRPIANASLELFSKPGLYGWNKIDKGSEFLIQEVKKRETNLDKKEQLIDLGCGFGYLSVEAAQLGAKNIIATDNNAAALSACRHNFEHHNINGEVIADDCGQSIDTQADILLCNPPFHQGFNVESSLTDKFIQAANRLLRNSGTAYFVVNAFIPFEKKASIAFSKVNVLNNNKQFKVIAVQK